MPTDQTRGQPGDSISAEDDRALRHDLRNLLSPAMIALDRLSAHADPAIRAEAERGIAAIEAATARLRRRSV